MTQFITLKIEPWAIFPKWHHQYNPPARVTINVAAIATLQERPTQQHDHSLREKAEGKNDFKTTYNDPDQIKKDITVTVVTLLSTQESGESEVYQVAEPISEIMRLINGA